MFRACGALPALGYPAQRPKPVAFDALRLPRLKPGSLSIRCGAANPRLSSTKINAEGNAPARNQLELSGPGGSGGHSGGSSGGWNGGNGGNDGDGDGNEYFSGGLVLFLAGIPFIVDSMRRWSFGKDGIRVLQISADTNLPKPIFAAVAMGRPAGPPSPAAESMSGGGGGAGSFVGGVLALLILCAGGYYILNKRKRGSGAPSGDDEDDALQMQPVDNVGTRSLDPALFQRPAPAESSEPEIAPPPTDDPLINHAEKKDNVAPPPTDDALINHAEKKDNAAPPPTDDPLISHMEKKDNAAPPSDTPLISHMEEKANAAPPSDDPLINHVEEKNNAAPPSDNPLINHMDEKDKFFVSEGPSEPPPMAAIPAPSSAPPEAATPAADITPKQPTPDQVVKDMSGTHPQHVAINFGSNDGNYFMADLSNKDDMFGRPAEPDMEPLQPGATMSTQKPIVSSSKEAAIDPNDLLQQQIEKDKFFGAEDHRSEVEVRPVSAPKGFGDIVVPKAPSAAAKKETKNVPPDDVVMVYDSMPLESDFIKKSDNASLLKEMEDKDSMFGEKPPATITVGAAEVEIPRQILDVVSDPIMTDIAKQLEGKDDCKEMVGVGLDIAGDTVALKLNFLPGQDVAKPASEHSSSSPGVAAPSTPTADPPSKAVPEDTIQTKPPAVEAPPQKGQTPLNGKQEGGEEEHEDEGSASPHEEGNGVLQQNAQPVKKKKRTRRSKKNKKSS